MQKIWVILFLAVFALPAGTGTMSVPMPVVAENIVDNDIQLLEDLKGEMALYISSRENLDHELKALNHELDKIEAVNFEIRTVSQLIESDVLPVETYDSPTPDREFHIQVRKKNGN